MRSDRISTRANMKEKLANLEHTMRASKVIAAAQQMLQHVSREGYMAGYKACEADYAKRAENTDVISTDPAGDNTSTDEAASSALNDEVINEIEVVDVVNNPTDLVQL